MGVDGKSRAPDAIRRNGAPCSTMRSRPSFRSTRRDRLAQALTDGGVETLKHLARVGMGESTLRALASDVAYLEAWALAATEAPLPWLATESLLLKLCRTHRVWDPAQHETDVRYGMPKDVTGARGTTVSFRSEGPQGAGELSDGAFQVGRHSIAGKDLKAQVRLPCPAVGASARRARFGPSAPPKEPARRDPRRPRSAARDVRY